MSEYSFLSKEQVETSEVKKKGKTAEITDFYIFLGWNVRNTNNRMGEYWTKTAYDSSSIYTLNEWGKMDTIGTDDRCCGIRPTISISYISENYPDIEADEEGIIEFGHYPQTVASIELQDELEQAYTDGTLNKTGNTYTTDSQSIFAGNGRSADSSFKPQVHEEVEYNGKRYVRVKVNDSLNIDNTVSNGEKYEKGDCVWVEVEPVKWLMDEKLGVFILERILVAGLQYNEKKSISESLEHGSSDRGTILRERLEDMFSYSENGVDFENSHIKYFIDEYFSRDLEQSMIRAKSKETARKQVGETEEYQIADTESFAMDGISGYDKIGDMYQRYLTKEKEIEENENDK